MISKDVMIHLSQHNSSNSGFTMLNFVKPETSLAVSSSTLANKKNLFLFFKAMIL